MWLGRVWLGRGETNRDWYSGGWRRGVARLGISGLGVGGRRVALSRLRWRCLRKGGKCDRGEREAIKQVFIFKLDFTNWRVEVKAYIFCI